MIDLPFFFGGSKVSWFQSAFFYLKFSQKMNKKIDFTTMVP